jgi:hypothetical protein
VSQIQALYRSPDIHQRILAMARWYFPYTTYNELVQMVGETSGGGMYVQPTFTLAEGQAVMANPVYMDKARLMGLDAFYDYVYTIDWFAHRLNVVQNILNTMSTGSHRDMGDLRLYQEQLDTMLMSPNRVPWYMWDRPEVRALLVDQSVTGANMAVIPGVENRRYVQLMGIPAAEVEDAQLDQRFRDDLRSNTWETKDNISLAAHDPAPSVALKAARAKRHLLVAQEAVVLTSSLWNELVAIGQGLYRVQLTYAPMDLGGGVGTVPPGAFVNAFTAGSRVIDVTLKEYKELPTGAGVGLVGNGNKRLPTHTNDADQYRALDNLLPEAVSQQRNFKDLPEIRTDNALVASWDQSDLRRGVLQPKNKNLLISALMGAEKFFPHGKVDVDQLYRDMTASHNTKDLWRLSRFSHDGMGGAIGNWVTDGLATGFMKRDIGDPDKFILPYVRHVTSDEMKWAMEHFKGKHPIAWCARLVEAMQRATTHDATDVQAGQLDPSHQPRMGMRTVFDYLRGRVRELENQYALLRRAQVSASNLMHPIGTAATLVNQDFMAYGPNHQFPQCPVGSVPQIWDSIHNQNLSHEQWSKQVVEINGAKMLPAHLQVQACLPGRVVQGTGQPLTVNKAPGQASIFTDMLNTFMGTQPQ